MENLSVKKWPEVGKNQHEEQQCCDDPENDLVTTPNYRDRTHFTRLALGIDPINTTPRKHEADDCRASEKRPIGFKHRKVRQPCAAEADAHEDERANAASTGEQCSNATYRQGCGLSGVFGFGHGDLQFQVWDGKLNPVVNYGVKRMVSIAKSESSMTIGRLAERTGVHFETIRYYQQLGLMPTPARPLGSVRRYGPDAVKRLRFIKRAQGLGFSLDEVRLLLGLSVGEHCTETRILAQQKMRLVEDKIESLLSIKAALNKLIRACGTGKGGQGCPIIESLSLET